MKKHFCLSIGVFLLAVLPAEAQEVSGTYLSYKAPLADKPSKRKYSPLSLMLETLQKWMAELITGGAR